jgi:hypothetical protein
MEARSDRGALFKPTGYHGFRFRTPREGFVRSPLAKVQQQQNAESGECDPCGNGGQDFENTAYVHGDEYLIRIVAAGRKNSHKKCYGFAAVADLL